MKATKKTHSPASKPALPRMTKIAAPAPATTAAPTPAPAASITLTFRSPAARQVSVAGSFNGWRPGSHSLRITKEGEWKTELQLAPGRYEYLFVVDGAWLPDPAARESAPNPFGGRNSVLAV